MGAEHLVVPAVVEVQTASDYPYHDEWPAGNQRPEGREETKRHETRNGADGASLSHRAVQPLGRVLSAGWDGPEDGDCNRRLMMATRHHEHRAGRVS